MTRGRGRKPRTTRTRSRRPLFVVYCEGDKTEREYVEHLRSSLPSDAVSIRVETPGSARRTLADAASTAVKELSKGPQDIDWSVWILCDVDDDGAVLRQLGAAGGGTGRYKWAVSNPSIAAWLLMHVQRLGRPEHRDLFASQAAQKNLLSGKNKKTLEPGRLKGLSGAAVAEAERLRKKHLGDGTEFPNDNPSSTVPLMLEDLVGMYNRTDAGKLEPVSVQDLY